MRNLNLAILALLGSLGAMPALADETTGVASCYGYLTEMVRSSNYPYRDFTTPDKLKLLIDTDKGDELSLQLFYDTSGSGIIGWVKYEVEQQKLWNITIDPEEPEALTFDKQWATRYAACIQS